MPSFGKWLMASAIVVGGVALVEQYDNGMAYWLAIMILLALFFRYPRAWAEIEKAFGGRPQLPPNERT